MKTNTMVAEWECGCSVWRQPDKKYAMFRCGHYQEGPRYAKLLLALDRALEKNDERRIARIRKRIGKIRDLMAERDANKSEYGDYLSE